MTATHISADAAAENPPSGLVSWVTSADHKQIGRLFVGAGLLALIGALVVAVLVGMERIDAGSYQLLDEGAVTQLFTAYRALVAFGAVAPLLIGLAVAIVPLQLGAKGLALPRVAAAGFWTWLVGLGLALASLAANGGPGGGSEDMVELFLASMVLVALGLALAAVSVATSVLTTRAPGMDLVRVPMLAWSALVGSVALLATLPVMMGTTIYLLVDQRAAQATFGGSAGILEWIGWSLGQPHTHVLAIVAVGVLADIVPVMARIRLPKRQVVLAAIGVLAVSALGAVTQQSARLPWVGDGLFDEAATNLADLLPYLLFYAVPVLGVLGVVVISLLALRSGRSRLTAPLVLSLTGVLLLLAGMGGQLVFAVDDAGLSGTVFEEGQFALVTYGAALAALGGLAYWGPKLWGRRLPDLPAIVLALLGALGVVLAGAAYCVAGFADQPAVVLGNFDDSGPQAALNAIATVGQAIVAVAVLAFGLLAARSFAAGAPAGDDPWSGQTLEWATSSPPPDHNFAELPVVRSPEPLTDLRSSGSDA